MDAMISFAEYGLDEKEYDIQQMTGVNISGTTEQIRERISQYVDPANGFVRDFTIEDIWYAVGQYRAAREGIEAFAYMRSQRAKYEDTKKQRRKEAS